MLGVCDLPGGLATSGWPKTMPSSCEEFVSLKKSARDGRPLLPSHLQAPSFPLSILPDSMALAHFTMSVIRVRAKCRLI